MADVLGVGTGIGREEIEQMVELGLLEPLSGEGSAGADITDHGRPEVSRAPVQFMVVPAEPPVTEQEPALVIEPRTNQQRYQDAYQIAIRLTGGLGLRGFRLNLAVEGSSTCEQLRALAPKIRSAVGPEKAAELDRALDA
jgi:hypothetical protein